MYCVINSNRVLIIIKRKIVTNKNTKQEYSEGFTHKIMSSAITIRLSEINEA